jgi:hypothetical protein
MLAQVLFSALAIGSLIIDINDNLNHFCEENIVHVLNLLRDAVLKTVLAHPR